MRTISMTAIENIPMVKTGDDLAALIARGLDETGLHLEALREKSLSSLADSLLAPSVRR